MCSDLYWKYCDGSVGWQFADESDHVYWFVSLVCMTKVVGSASLRALTCVSTGKVSEDNNDDQDYQQLRAGVDNKRDPLILGVCFSASCICGGYFRKT